MEEKRKSILLNLEISDYEKIKEQAKKNRMTISSYIRYVLLLKNKKVILQPQYSLL